MTVKTNETTVVNTQILFDTPSNGLKRFSSLGERK
jgi:hypothetical protein